MATSANQARQYLIHLDERLKARNPEILEWEDYFEGVHKLQFATSRFRSTFGNLFREFADNWCELIVEASVERLHIQGFRVGDGAKDSDSLASQIWRDNHLDADHVIAHTEAVKLAHAYLLVDQDNKAYDTESPLITIEHPAQAIVLHHPANRRHRVAALKEWMDPETGVVYATVYTPDTIFRFEAEEKGPSEEEGLTPSGITWGTDYLAAPSSAAGRDIEWVPRNNGDPFEQENRLGIVPMVPLANNPTLKGGRSDIAQIIPIQNAVNKTLMDMLIASEFASFAQRWATGLEVPKDPQTGRAMSNSDFLSGAGRVWVSEHPDAKFGQFEASDLGNYVKAIEMLIQHLAATTRTPPHYLLGQSGAFPSGDSLTATETGLVAKVKRKARHFGPEWAEVQRLAFLALGKKDKAKEPISTIWGDPEQRIRSQRIDGAVKLMTIGTPQKMLWEEAGYTPDDIERMEAMKVEMGQTEHSSEFAEMPELEEQEIAEGKGGPEGVQKQEQSASEAARVARING